MKKMLMKPVMAILIGGALFGGMANAHSESTGNKEADFRIAEMKKLGMNMGAIAKVAKGEVAYSDSLNDNAEEIAGIAANMPKFFPEGSGVEASRAKPEIWTQPDEFQKDIEDFQAAATQLVVAVKSGDQAMIGAALKETGGTCGGCHKQFRKPKQ
ncbi:c-type cytochrome [Sneathiella sp. HT1-7]|jgi:cytochrome c556|uniref:c-type cytochrome n=1 Tax=Sneathiella sp. HT1-7 TaxID=2887192 RepID=UPI001D15CE24|nr:cytochrome c [Sneathiella sp. HT1-7]MCC3306264.1 cytochrome c [Sneathiella sp. HT1-7]